MQNDMEYKLSFYGNLFIVSITSKGLGKGRGRAWGASARCITDESLTVSVPHTLANFWEARRAIHGKIDEVGKPD